MRVEDALALYLSKALAYPVHREVPAERPEEFVTFERTGGPLRDVVTDVPTFAVQCWAQSERRAREMAHEAREAVEAMPEGDAGTMGVTVASLYNFPDGETPGGRYQITCEVEYQE